MFLETPPHFPVCYLKTCALIPLFRHQVLWCDVFGRVYYSSIVRLFWSFQEPNQPLCEHALSILFIPICSVVFFFSSHLPTHTFIYCFFAAFVCDYSMTQSTHLPFPPYHLTSPLTLSLLYPPMYLFLTYMMMVCRFYTLRRILLLSISFLYFSFAHLRSTIFCML